MQYPDMNDPFAEENCPGYYRYPCVHGDTVLFCCEDDLWCISAKGGYARRLTTFPGAVSYPTLSPDGKIVCFTVTDEGYQELYVMRACGGVAKRLTYLGAFRTRALTWTGDGERIVFTTSHNQTMPHTSEVYHVGMRGGSVAKIGFGSADHFMFEARRKPNQDGKTNKDATGPLGMMLGRHTADICISEWKRYRGGRVGEIWLDQSGLGNFQMLPVLKDIPKCSPVWVGQRIYFTSDHAEGRPANIFSCNLKGEDLQQHTHDNKGFYARDLSTDGETIVYHAGGSLYAYSIAEDTVTELDVTWTSQRSECDTRLVSGGEYLNDCDLHPDGHSIALTVRGHAVAMGLWHGAALRYNLQLETDISPPESAHAHTGDVHEDGEWETHSDEELSTAHGHDSQPQTVAPPVPRYRHMRYLAGGARLLVSSDGSGEEGLEVHYTDQRTKGQRLPLDPQVLGVPVDMATSPVDPYAAIVNHRNELLLLNLTTNKLVTVDVCTDTEPMCGLAFSPCGSWLAYEYRTGRRMSVIRVCDVRSGKCVDVTQGNHMDVSPAWDPQGCYLYFISSRDYEPYQDELHEVGMGFTKAQKPYLITLRADVSNPLLPDLRPPGDDDDETEEEEEDEEQEEEESAEEESETDDAPSDEKARKAQRDAWYEGIKESSRPKPIKINFKGIRQRIIALPVPIRRYGQLVGLKNKCLMYTSFGESNRPIGFDDDSDDECGESEALGGSERGSLMKFDVRDLKESPLMEGSDVTWMTTNHNHTIMLVFADGELKCVPAGESGGDDDDDDDEGAASRLSGVLDIDSRVLCEINPRHEWRQMFLETWRAMRDKYYSDNLNGVDWGAKRDLYLPLVARASCRSEVADILTELQSEMCTSHASAWGGDYKHRRHIKPGCLGADFTWSEEHGAYAISHIVNGDVWHPQNGGPLAKPAVGVRKGDLLVAINRRKLDRHTTPNELLLGMAYSEVLLSVMPKSAAKSDSKSKTKAVGKGTKTIGYGTGAAAEQPKKDMNGSINGSTKNAEHKSVGSVMTVPVAVTDSERDNDTSEEQRDSGTEMGVVRDSQTGRKILSKTNSSLGATVKSGREKHQTPNKGDNNIYESKNPGNAKTFGARKNSSVKKGAGTRRASTAPKQATTGGIAKESRSTPESSSESIRHIRVRCIGSDLYARYRDHIAHSRAHVRRTTNDRVGYIHLPDMERLGFSEFHRHFHTESRREGLIVDVRGNGGGYISELLLKSLAMPSLAVEISRYGAPIAYPTASVIGPVVMVCDEFTGSDGDCIVESFKTLKLGPVVGRRTWGGVVGTMDPLQLVDGSYTTQPEILILFLHKEAAPIENRGVEPDVHVIQTPQEHRKGKDTTLDAAVKVVMQKLAKEVPSFSSLMDQHRTPKDKPTIPKDWPFSMPALE